MAVWHQTCFNLKYGKEKAGFQARYEGTCAICGGKVSIGDRIGWPRRGSKTGKVPTNPTNTPPGTLGTIEPEQDDQDDQDGIEVTEPPTPHVPTTMPMVPAPGGDTIANALAAILLPLVGAQIDAKLGKLDPNAILRDVDQKIQARIAELSLPREIIVKTPEKPEGINVGRQHKQFQKLLGYLRSGCNVYIVGPAGTGKTTAVEAAFAAMGKPLNALSSITDRHGEVYGFRDAHGVYHESLVFDSYTRGKGMLVDEIDGSEPAELLAFNQVTANGRASFCNTMAEKHPECQFVATANTWGSGANAEYTGRARLDASTLDRFVILEWDLDEELETATCTDGEWVKYVQRVRANVARKGLKHLVTPRASYKGAALMAGLMATGFSREDAWAEAVKGVLRRNLNDDQWGSVK